MKKNRNYVVRVPESDHTIAINLPHQMDYYLILSLLGFDIKILLASSNKLGCFLFFSKIWNSLDNPAIIYFKVLLEFRYENISFHCLFKC